MAHSAIRSWRVGNRQLVEALHRLRAMELAVNPEVGPSTMNIGVMEGGRARNVILTKQKRSYCFVW